MKTKFITTLLLLFTTLSIATAQTIDVNIELKKYIDTKYKDALILEIEEDGINIEVEIIHNKKRKDLVFNKLGIWQSTKYDIKRSELPEKIKKIIKKSKYSSYKIDDVEVIETPTKSLYELGLDKWFGDEITIYVTLEGKII